MHSRPYITKRIQSRHSFSFLLIITIKRNGTNGRKDKPFEVVIADLGRNSDDECMKMVMLSRNNAMHSIYGEQMFHHVNDSGLLVSIHVYLKYHSIGILECISIQSRVATHTHLFLEKNKFSAHENKNDDFTVHVVLLKPHT